MLHFLDTELCLKIFSCDNNVRKTVISQILKYICVVIDLQRSKSLFFFMTYQLDNIHTVYLCIFI